MACPSQKGMKRRSFSYRVVLIALASLTALLLAVDSGITALDPHRAHTLIAERQSKTQGDETTVKSARP